MYNFNVFIEKEWKFYVARNLELWVVSQWESYEEALVNLREATALYLKDENEKKLYDSFEDKNYALTSIVV